jgi:hypothetical protein
VAAETLFSFPAAATATKIGGGTRNAQDQTILTNHRPSTNGEFFREAEVLADLCFFEAISLKRLDVER